MRNDKTNKKGIKVKKLFFILLMSLCVGQDDFTEEYLNQHKVVKNIIETIELSINQIGGFDTIVVIDDVNMVLSFDKFEQNSGKLKLSRFVEYNDFIQVFLCDEYFITKNFRDKNGELLNFNDRMKFVYLYDCENFNIDDFERYDFDKKTGKYTRVN